MENSTFFEVGRKKRAEAVQTIAPKLNLQKSSIDFDSLFESSPHLIIAADQNNNCVYLNEAARNEINGNVLNQPVEDLLIYGSLLHPITRNLLEGNSPQVEEHEIVIGNQTRWFEFHPNRISDEDGNVVGAFVILQDFTERKKKELELHDVRAKLQAQMKALDVFEIVAETDRRGRITYVNDQFVGISQYSREELLGQDHRIINSGVHPKSFFREMWAKISHGEVWSGEVCNRAKDGSIYWVSTVITPILDSAGKIKNFLAVRRDITSQKKAEEAIKESEARFRELLENVNLLAVGLDVRGKITFANSAFLKFSGRQWDEVAGLDWFSKFIPDRDYDRVFEAFSRTLTEDIPPTEYECKLGNSAGEARVVEWKNTLFRDNKGEIIGVTILGEDVTERKLAEKKIREFREQQEEQKEQIMAFVSHELRSPVNSIVVSADMLKNYIKGEGYGAEVPPEEILENINQQVQRMLRVSKDFIECSSHRSGKVQFDFKPTQLNRLLKNVCASFKQKLALKSHINFRFLPSDVEIIGYWDAARLDQVFTNLISNAIKYTRPESKTIEVRADVVERSAHIVVSDDGMGIPSENLQNLFQLFSRANNAKDSDASGFGLGLKISKDIVDKHAGKIWVESELGKGSRFHVVLPLQRPKSA